MRLLGCCALVAAAGCCCEQPPPHQPNGVNIGHWPWANAPFGSSSFLLSFSGQSWAANLCAKIWPAHNLAVLTGCGNQTRSKV